jgi:DNA-directed RNA polymerase
MRPTLEDQKQREDSFREQAEAKRVQDNKLKSASERTSGAMSVLKESVILATSRAIEDMVARTEAGKAGAGNPGVAVRYLQQLDPTATALLTARVVFDCAGARVGLTRAALKLAGVINDHYLFDELEQEAGGLVHHIQMKQRTRAAGKFKATIMRRATRLVPTVQGLQWGEGERLKLGTKLIELFMGATGLIEVPNVSIGKGKTMRTVVFADRAAGELAMLDEMDAMRATDYRAMIYPPANWTSPTQGGYHTRVQKQPLVRGQGAETRDDMFSSDLTHLYAALNAIQSTAWSINQPVYDLLKECLDSGAQLGGLPPADSEPTPARPTGIPESARLVDLPEKDAVRIKAWKVAAAQVHTQNHIDASRRKMVIMQRSVAEELQQWERFWFPHNLDFRGRLYPLPPVLNPQSDDMGKALLQFADGKPLGSSGAYWLAVHIANLFGEDKVSFHDRVTWVNDNSAALLDSAMNPLDGQRFWETANKPWCALAACFEYAGWFVQGDEYVSHLPIAMDGSCSGLQHFSAILRDEVGAKAVNLRVNEEPADIYTEVLGHVESVLKGEADGLAAAWLSKLSRKIVKRPCMTFAYSVTRRGITDQIRDELRREYGEQALPGFENHEAAAYLTPFVDDAIRSVVIKAAEGMDWLKEASGHLTAKKMPLLWVTPIGLPVLQDKRKHTSKKHKVWFGGQRMRLTLRTPTTVIDTTKQALSVAPNFIHSMDAAHLMLVTNRMVDEEITDSFAMIHDSFGVHACDVDELHVAIRDEFVKMYSVDRLLQFRNHVLSRLPLAEREDVPMPPTQGDYDLEEVRDADFFFA